MSTPTKTILGVGLTQGTDAKGQNWDPAALRERMQAQARASLEAGYAVTMHLFDPPADLPAEYLAATLEEVRAVLKGRDYDGVIVGFGLRGDGGLTPLFQGVVNVVAEVAVARGREIKLVFPVVPTETTRALDGVFRG